MKYQSPCGYVIKLLNTFAGPLHCPFSVPLKPLTERIFQAKLLVVSSENFSFHSSILLATFPHHDTEVYKALSQGDITEYWRDTFMLKSIIRSDEYSYDTGSL